MAAAVTATALSVPMTAFAEQYDIVDDTDGRFCMSEVDGAVSKEWDGTVADSYAGGTGTEEDPYRIATGEQLAFLAENVDNGTDYEGSYFTLTADILLNDNVDVEPNEWSSIGDKSKETIENTIIFNGTFDGADHKVIGLYQNSSKAHGLFESVGSKGTVKNLGVTDGNITADNDYVGGICGHNYGTISNCYNSVKITSSTNHEDFGGVCGTNNGKISNCRNNGELYITNDSSYNTYSIGGVCGNNDYGEISGSCNTGRVYTTSSHVRYVGGVCGSNTYGTISECYNTGEIIGYDSVGGVCGDNAEGTISDSYNSGEVTGRNACVGGICGYSISTENYDVDVIVRCYNTGNVQNTNTIAGFTGLTGGICGQFAGNNMIQCFNTGNIYGNQTCITGGVCGLSGEFAGECKIKECYNSGSVTSSWDKVGGIVGCINYDSTIENCYNTGVIKGDEQVGGVWGASNKSGRK